MIFATADLKGVRSVPARATVGRGEGMGVLYYVKILHFSLGFEELCYEPRTVVLAAAAAAVRSARL